jgi:hypothetical protein
VPTKTSVEYVAPVDQDGHAVKGFSITQTRKASCQAGSDVLSVAAYRCFAGNGVFDPCWAVTNGSAPPTTVLCLLQPWSTSVEALVTTGLPASSGNNQKPPLGYPFGVELESGQRCLAQQGAHSHFDGEVVNFGCPGNVVLLGSPDRTHELWTFRTASQSGGAYVAGPTVTVRTAWFGWP